MADKGALASSILRRTLSLDLAGKDQFSSRTTRKSLATSANLMTPSKGCDVGSATGGGTLDADAKQYQVPKT